ncbi:RNA binding domain-containing protein [Plectosphaerella plurivora]|uniref:RNA binding domain-containing protein n=1 Tax=Plectosphaerella plurivora TaxID=936078 RepID=A0A9P8VHS8_9PEZI|nr:RNA binding domain-containing protein [Plectosphaerella plurivora]
MAANMDRSLDEILAEKRKDNPRGGNRRGGRRDGGNDSGADRPPRRNDRSDRNDYPRDGIRKVAPPALPPSYTSSRSLDSSATPLTGIGLSAQSYRDEPRNLDSEWVHDRYEDDSRGGRSAPRRRRESPEIDSTTSKLKVENLHYDLNEKDLDGLFARIGPVSKLVLLYDRAGRSEGVAYVTYEDPEDARAAIREFDGANANGQPIRLYLVPNNGGRGRGGGGGGGGRNPFDTAVMPSRPLSERVSRPSGRGRSRSPGRNQDIDDAAERGIDRYVPGSRNRSPRRRGDRGGGGGGGRRPGARHETGGGRGQQSDGPRGAGRRPKKTQEELDAEMADYFGGNGDSSAAPAAAPANNSAPAAGAAGGDDIDMIE